MRKSIGFLFFSSMMPGTYQNAHVEKFVQIALQISIIVEKGRLYEGLKRTNLRLKAENLEHKKTADKLRQARSELDLANQQLVQLASRDGLTGVANRHTFDEMLTLPTKVPSNSLGQRGGLGRIRSKPLSPMAL